MDKNTKARIKITLLKVNPLYYINVVYVFELNKIVKYNNPGVSHHQKPEPGWSYTENGKTYFAMKCALTCALN